MRQIARVIIPDTLKPRPEPHEIEVGWILARHFKTKVEFLLPLIGYKAKSPDIIMQAMTWEIKSPTGNSRQTIQYQFKGLKQSRNLVIDGRRTKLSDRHIQKRIMLELTKHHRVGAVLFVTKQERVIAVR